MHKGMFIYQVSWRTRTSPRSSRPDCPNRGCRGYWPWPCFCGRHRDASATECALRRRISCCVCTWRTRFRCVDALRCLACFDSARHCPPSSGKRMTSSASMRQSLWRRWRCWGFCFRIDALSARELENSGFLLLFSFLFELMLEFKELYVFWWKRRKILKFFPVFQSKIFCKIE